MKIRGVSADFNDMERRLHQRYPVRLPATIVDLANPERAATGELVDASESGVRVEVSEFFQIGAIVELQLPGCKLFGAVVHSRLSVETQQIGIEVVRALIGESDLGQLVKSMLAEAMPQVRGLAATPDSAR